MRDLSSPVRRARCAATLLLGALGLAQAFGAVEPAALPSGADKAGTVAPAARREAPVVAGTALRGKAPADDKLEACREIVQRASLQPLTPEDAATLRKRCN